MPIGHAAVAALRPFFEEWLERRHGTLTYRLTHVLTGHGSFSRFLFVIRLEETPSCHHCYDHPWPRTRWRCALHGRNTAVPSGRQPATSADSLARRWSRPCCGARKNLEAVTSFCDAVMLEKAAG